MINRSRNMRASAAMTRRVVRGDWLFTATAVVFQPLSGLVLAHMAGIPLATPWVFWTFVLHFVAGACWLPVVWIQTRMRDLAELAARENTSLPTAYWRWEKLWTVLGFPAFSRCWRCSG